MSTPGGNPGLSFGGADYFRGNVYLLKIDNTNTPQWLEFIQKNQTEPDAPLSIGTACHH